MDSEAANNHHAPRLELVAAAIHGNCVFSDAEEPATVQHLSGRSVVSGQNDGHGKIHFPLGLLWEDGMVKIGEEVPGPGAWLRVDCGPIILVQDAQHTVSSTEIVKAEVFVGCVCIWSKDFVDSPKTTTFRELLEPIMLVVGSEDGPKALEVTLTLKFGLNAMKFCSVAVYGVRLGPLQVCREAGQTAM